MSVSNPPHRSMQAAIEAPSIPPPALGELGGVLSIAQSAVEVLKEKLDYPFSGRKELLADIAPLSLVGATCCLAGVACLGLMKSLVALVGVIVFLVMPTLVPHDHCDRHRKAYDPLARVG